MTVLTVKFEIIDEEGDRLPINSESDLVTMLDMLVLGPFPLPKATIDAGNPPVKENLSQRVGC
jgi:hypothetical protein